MRMRLLASLAGALLAATAAQAEKRVFVVANNADGYGIDRCLATGANCGKAAAAAYCRAQAFDEALAFGRIDPADVTSAAPANSPGCRGVCGEFVAIECRR